MKSRGRWTSPAGATLNETGAESGGERAALQALARGSNSLEVATRLECGAFTAALSEANNSFTGRRNAIQRFSDFDFAPSL